MSPHLVVISGQRGRHGLLLGDTEVSEDVCLTRVERREEIVRSGIQIHRTGKSRSLLLLRSSRLQCVSGKNKRHTALPVETDMLHHRDYVSQKSTIRLVTLKMVTLGL